MGFDAAAYLDGLKDAPGEVVDPGLAALALGALDLPGIVPGRYAAHLELLSQDVSKRYKALVAGGSDDDAGVRLAALKHVLSDQYGYCSDSGLEALEGANLVRVIENRKGFPDALAVLYVHAGMVQGWDVCMLAFPYAALCRIDYGGVRLIFDPAQQCRVLQAPDLRAILKEKKGAQAELSAGYYDALDGRSVVVRLENHAKLRLIGAGDYAAALQVVERMMAVDPDEYRLLLDAGVLAARCGQIKQAEDYLEGYISRAPSLYEREEAILLLRQIRSDALS
ncbi:MAG: tetratricopeptide repeat protein [Alphaproteobacteria bacterium]|nr:tetratricopeptide repeat protein [Alphaproteobacteria bacterium]